MAAAASAVLAQQGLSAGGASARPVSASAQAPHGPHQVRTATYDLGNNTFHNPNFSLPLELEAVVHYRKNLGGGPHPLITQEHGAWVTCADREAQEVIDNAPPPGPTPTPEPGETKPPAEPEDPDVVKAWEDLSSWPCRPGVPSLPSYRGYDYLGENLASYGFIVVSVSDNAVNSYEYTEKQVGDSYQARADMINKHLALWQQLNSTGGGPLAGKITDPATGRPARVDFKGHVDMRNVGTMGHSRAGQGVMRQAADRHQGNWPSGVEVKAVLAMAPVYPGHENADKADTLVTGIPVAGLTASCDGAGGSFRRFFDDASGKNPTGLYDFTVQGANHNFFNTQWSPESGQVAATDDAMSVPGSPGDCDEGDYGDPKPVKELTEAQQRQIATVYIADFYRRFLLDDKTVTPVLNGDRKPFADVTPIDVRAEPPLLVTVAGGGAFWRFRGVTPIQVPGGPAVIRDPVVRRSADQQLGNSRLFPSARCLM